MGANNFTIKSAATSMTVVGGTDATYTETAKVVSGGIESSVVAVADFRLRPFAEFTNRQPVLGTDGLYTKGKRSGKFVFPRLDANGKPYFDVWRVTAEVSPITAQADVTDMRLRVGQSIGITLIPFWDTGVVR